MSANGLRFKVGELAIFAIARAKSGYPYAGQIVEIQAMGPFKIGYQWPGCKPIRESKDYFISAQNGVIGSVRDWQLVKLNDPDKQVDQEEECEVEA